MRWPEGVEHRSAGCLQGRGPGPFPGRGRRRPTGPRLGVGRGHVAQARGRENQASLSRGARGQGPRGSEVSKVRHITDSSGRVACGRDGSVPEKPTGEERGEEKTLFMPRPQVIHWAARSCPLCLAPCAHCLQLGRLGARAGGLLPASLPTSSPHLWLLPALGQSQTSHPPPDTLALCCVPHPGLPGRTPGPALQSPAPQGIWSCLPIDPQRHLLAVSGRSRGGLGHWPLEFSEALTIPAHL